MDLTYDSEQWAFVEVDHEVDEFRSVDNAVEA